jgi:hypothetical protein
MDAGRLNRKSEIRNKSEWAEIEENGRALKAVQRAFHAAAAGAQDVGVEQ